MTGKKLSVVQDGQLPATRASSTKPFDDFSKQMTDLGELYVGLKKVLDRTTAYSLSTEGKLRKIVSALDYLGAIRPDGSIAKCEEFCELFHNDDDDEVYRTAVGQRVARLVGCYANANVGDPQIFVSTLIDDVAAADKPIIVVEAAFRKLRRTKKFLPAISEIIEMLEAENDAWEPRFDALHGGIEYLREDLETKRAELEKELEAEKERRRAADQAAEQNRALFPLKTQVVHAKYGLGIVGDHPGHLITAIFGPPDDWRNQQRYSVPPEQLHRVIRGGVLGSVQVDERVFHTASGMGTVFQAASFLDELPAGVEFDAHGRREVEYDKLLVVIPNPPSVAVEDKSVSQEPGVNGASPDDALQVGSRVRHHNFLGTVSHVDSNKLTVDFDTAGRKMVLNSFVEGAKP